MLHHWRLSGRSDLSHADMSGTAWCAFTQDQSPLPRLLTCDRSTMLRPSEQYRS